ncbi:MAG: Gp37 family protein [Stellaceae bacterium]
MSLTYGSMPVSIDPTAWAGRTFSPAEAEDVGSVQGAIAAQLDGFLQGAGLAIPVYVFPDFDLDTWWKSAAIAFVLISYQGTRLGKPMTTDAMVQERLISFDLHVEARQTAWALTGTGSVYALIDAVEAALTGFRPPACRNAYFAEERFAEQDAEGRVWLYDMRLEVPTLKLKTEPAYALANLVQAQMYVAAIAAAAGLPGGSAAVTTESYSFGGSMLTLPAPFPLVVGAIANAAGTVLYREFVDWTCDGATGVVTAVPGGAIGANDTVLITWAAADTVTVTAN